MKPVINNLSAPGVVAPQRTYAAYNHKAKLHSLRVVFLKAAASTALAHTESDGNE